MTELDKDIIQALRYQVMIQNQEIAKYRAWIRRIGKDTPHQWVRDEAKEVLDGE